MGNGFERISLEQSNFLFLKSVSFRNQWEAFILMGNGFERISLEQPFESLDFFYFWKHRIKNRLLTGRAT